MSSLQLQYTLVTSNDRTDCFIDFLPFDFNRSKTVFILDQMFTRHDWFYFFFYFIFYHLLLFLSSSYGDWFKCRKVKFSIVKIFIIKIFIFCCASFFFTKLWTFFKMWNGRPKLDEYIHIVLIHNHLH